MPVSPDVGSAHAAQVTDLMTRQELKLLETAALALRGDQTRPEWAATALERIQRFRAQADKGVAGALAELGKAVRAALLGAQADGLATALVDLPDVPSVGPVDVRGLDLSEAKLGRALAGALQQTPRLLEATLREAVRAGVDDVRAGTVTRRGGAQAVLDRLVAQGVTGFRDSAGRRWSLASYTEMAVRTETQARALAAGDAMLRTTGLDLVIVSDSPRECPICRPFEGKVLSLDGAPGQPSTTVRRPQVGGQAVAVRVMTSLAEARARGFQHPNCTHSYSGYIPGVTQQGTAEANPEGYEQKQRQRELERRVRTAKRVEVLALDPTAKKAARAKVRAAQATLRQYVADKDLKRQPGRESIKNAI